ncbi:hypothetical protein PYCC9005_001645 [Savitreella phatthalungensis]
MPADWHVSAAASTASLVSTSLGYPIDSIKTRMQTYSYASIVDCARQTYRSEGAAGFYRGLAIPLLTVTLARTTSFSIYEGSRKSVAVLTQGSPQDLASTFIGGLAAGLSVSALAAPFELTKLASQLEKLIHGPRGSTARSSTVMTTAKAIYGVSGIRGFYAGYGWHAMRDGLGTAFFFSTYVKVKAYLSQYSKGGAEQPWMHAVSGGTCGIVAWTLVYPIDTLKAVTQRDLLQGKDGRTTAIAWRTLYRGVHVSLIRSGMINSANFMIYEQVLKYLHTLDRTNDSEHCDVS